ncbi:DsbA family protein [Pararhizobium mangrovi]|uniref:DsbA family protein n=1 Tax=Pararhizobium mangrovi TaxID=2590452 RepID=A0A506U2U6_9HYPH|nr:DsbA family protein [Pararhizobium mangrovi]TPW28682.1 DsbA family protein [Pararhizobium mangrovi]
MPKSTRFLARTATGLFAALFGLTTFAGAAFAAGTDHTPSGVDPIVTAATEDAGQAPKPAGNVDMDKVVSTHTLDDRVMGSKDAPITMVEYFSMTCPHCRDFENKTLDGIKKKYIDTGKVKYIGRLFPLFSPKQDPRGAAASALARCVPADQYYPMISVLYEQWDQWALPSAKEPKQTLMRISKLAGLSEDKFRDCLTNQKLVSDIFDERNNAAQEFDVSATPTFFIDGKKYEGFMTVDQMSSILDKAK